MAEQSSTGNRLNGVTWVVKIGSSLVTQPNGLSSTRLDVLCRQLCELKHLGLNVIVVSSGAIAEGSRRLGLSERPSDLPTLQTVAAVGQMGLMHAYQSRFQQENLHVGMVLLTHDDFKNRVRYLNARGTIETCLKHNIIPVINENDSVSTEEIKFGDNDTLAARVAALVQADVLAILTDQSGLFERDPRVNPNVELIRRRSAFDESLDEMVNSEPGPFGRGGMLTKLEAARYAARSGCETKILDGRLDDALLQAVKGCEIGTCLEPEIAPLEARKQWIAGQLRSHGVLVVDEGAVQALREKGVSLLPIGTQAIRGDFHRGDLVTVEDEDGNEIARGLSNYSNQEARTIMGHASSEIEDLLGYMDQPELIHRDNLALT